MVYSSIFPTVALTAGFFPTPSRQMCDVILRFAEEGEEFHGKAPGVSGVFCRWSRSGGLGSSVKKISSVLQM